MVADEHPAHRQQHWRQELAPGSFRRLLDNYPVELGTCVDEPFKVAGVGGRAEDVRGLDGVRLPPATFNAIDRPIRGIPQDR